MTRGDVAQVLADLLAPYGVPVAPDPITAVIPPAVILEPTGPYRSRETACWVQTLDAVVVAGRLDSVDCYDALDELADTFCRIVTKPILNRGASAAPAVRTIGDVDYLSVVFTLTVYDIGPGLIGG